MVYELRVRMVTLDLLAHLSAMHLWVLQFLDVQHREARI